MSSLLESPLEVARGRIQVKTESRHGVKYEFLKFGLELGEQHPSQRRQQAHLFAVDQVVELHREHA
jgi:hypothetical protein